MKKYRRIEVNAFRRRVTIVSGGWRDSFYVPPAETTDETSLKDTDLCEPVEPDSPEGQLILVEAVRSLERRLSPEARAKICAGPKHSRSKPLKPKWFLFQIAILLSIYLPKGSALCSKGEMKCALQTTYRTTLGIALV